MTEILAGDRGAARRITLAFTIALHFLGIYLWVSMMNRPTMSQAENPTILLHLFTLPLQQPAARQSVARTRSLLPQSTPKNKQQNAPHAPAADVPPQSSSDISNPAAASHTEDSYSSDTTSSKPISTEQMILNAKRDVGKIDRDLRKAFPKLPETAPDTAQSRMAKGIAAAGKGKWGRMEERVLPGGRRITNIVTPLGTYCVTYEGAAAADGVDQMQRGVQQKISSCAHFFD
ncbi:hypothetical protein [Collimonas sp.]|jgi:hypothetical protein|uniref:hypothetical protein n=1 Tax=Collimonas sp. TaxID=1963772 RepID=UPI002BDA1CE0|nr:hypothetical protein [Collimonas sp.]HWW05944.1 hypothetical protein [Collimonas sp.]